MAHRCRDECAEREHGRQRVNPPTVLAGVDLVDAAEQLERVARRQLIPELRPLAEHSTDLKRELTALARRESLKPTTVIVNRSLVFCGSTRPSPRSCS